MPSGSVACRQPEPAAVVKWVANIMAGIISSMWKGFKQIAQQMTETSPLVLIEAVRNDDLEHLRRLLQDLRQRSQSLQAFKSRYLEYEEPSSGWTALAHAASLGHAQCVYLLLDAGAASSHADFQGRTPLHLACTHGHTAVVHKLLSGTSDPFVEDTNGFTALDYALKLDASKKDHVALVRAVERCGLFSGTLSIKVAKWPFRKAWESRWTLVTPRRNCRRVHPNSPPRLLMTWFKTATSFEVMGKVWLTDVTVKMSEEAGNPPEMSLSLQRGHEKPSDAFCVTDTHNRHTLQLRAVNDSITARQALVAVCNTIQTRPPVVPPPSQAAPAATAHPQLAASQAGQSLHPAALPLNASAAVLLPSAHQYSLEGQSAAAHLHHNSVTDDEAMARALQEEFDRQAGGSRIEAPANGPLGQGATRMNSPQAASSSGSGRTSFRKKRASLPSSAPARVPTRSSGSEPEDNWCLICQEREPTSGFLHGSSIHKCVCKGCANMYIDRKIQDCPMCREKIAQVVLDIY